MNIKYCLLVGLLLGSFVMPVYLQAKPTQNQLDNSNSSTSDTQSDSVSFPKVSQIQFSGNTAIASDILQKAIPLKVNDIANEYNIMDSMVKIAQLYKAKNIKVTITPVLEKISINSKNIQFDIHEVTIDKN